MKNQPTKSKEEWKGCLKHDYPQPWCGQCEEANTPPAKGERWEKELDKKLEYATTHGLWVEKVIKDFIRSTRAQAYEEGRREAIEEAKAIFVKHKEEPMTGNVVLLELGVLLMPLRERKKYGIYSTL